MKQTSIGLRSPLAEMTSRVILCLILISVMALTAPPILADAPSIIETYRKKVPAKPDVYDQLFETEKPITKDPTIVQLIWGPKYGAIPVALSMVFAVVVLGGGLYKAIRLCESPDKPALAQGTRWAAYASVVAVIVTNNQVHKVSATDLFLVFLLFLVTYCTIAFALGCAYWFLRHRIYPSVSDRATKLVVNRATPLDKDTRDFYATALHELNENKPVAGLWAQCLAKANGNESVARAKYLKARAAELPMNAPKPQN